jgi:transcriptional regulator with XRE-family HTH domain
MKHHLGEALQVARKSSGLEQAELGALLGTDKQTISKTERGQRRMQASELITFARIFGDQFEFATEAHMSELVADLATRLRKFLGVTKFAPDKIGKREWLRQLLSELDNTYVTEIT